MPRCGSGHAIPTPRPGNHRTLGSASRRIADPEQWADGRLAPQGQVQVADKVGLFDDVVGGGWQLISRVADPADVLSEEAAIFPGSEQIGGVFADLSHADGPVVDVEGGYRRWFTERGCEAFLARPDFYVFAAGENADIPRFLSRLRQALDPASAPDRILPISDPEERRDAHATSAPRT